jgi:hypothetical protein
MVLSGCSSLTASPPASYTRFLAPINKLPCRFLLLTFRIAFTFRCLDGAQRLLKPGGISIPSSYTSFLAPVTTSKLWDAVRNYKDLEHCETPYVVKFHRWGLVTRLHCF